MTKLNTGAAESISSACVRFTTDLAAVRGLDLETARWIQHDPPYDALPHSFNEVQFTWDSDHIAHDPKWQCLDDKQVEALTGESLTALNRPLGDFGVQMEGEIEHEGTET